MDGDPLAFWRGCLWAIPASLIFWAALIFGVCAAVESAPVADHKACAHPVLPMPRTVVIRPDIPGGVQPWRNAIAEWNAFDPARVRFVEMPQNYEADVYIVGSWHAPNPAHRYMTRVAMPCNSVESVVYVGTDDIDLDYWATHELGHTLAFADHIRAVNNVPGWFVNPKICDNGTDTYVGIMSYCTPRSQWWGWADRLMLWWWF